VEQLYSFDAERKIDGATSIASFCSPRRDNVNGLWGGGMQRTAMWLKVNGMALTYDGHKSPAAICRRTKKKN